MCFKMRIISVALVVQMLLACFVFSAVSANAATNFGDVDGDGKISLVDVVLVQRSIANIIVLKDNQREQADVSGDEKISLTDVVNIQRYLAGIIKFFPADSISPKPTEISTHVPTQPATDAPTQSSTDKDGWNEQVVKP